MPEFKLNSPIPKKYHIYRRFCLITQLFGENKNSSFYGPKGHEGIDFRTKGPLKFLFHRVLGYRLRNRFITEATGAVPIQAAHSGWLTHNYNDDPINGIYAYVTSDEMVEGDTLVQYRTTYFHLDSVRIWKDDQHTSKWEEIKGKNYVRYKTVLGIAGNTGKYTTGAHLHFTLQKRMHKNGKWTSWWKLNPMPYFKDNVVYKALSTNQYFYKGAEIPEVEANNKKV